MLSSSQTHALIVPHTVPGLQVNPIKGNVAFSSATSGWSFTLLSFAQLYKEVTGVEVDPRELARRFWGDVYFHPDSRTFKKKAASAGQDRTFVSVRISRN